MSLSTIIIILAILLTFVILLHEFECINDDIFKYCRLVLALGIIFFNILNIIDFYDSYKTKNQHTQNISYPISSKEVVREKDKITYKLNFETKSSVGIKKHTIYITKEEYDLLKRSDEIPFILNTKTKSIRLDEEKFNELIEMRRLKKESTQ